MCHSSRTTEAFLAGLPMAALTAAGKHFGEELHKHHSTWRVEPGSCGNPTIAAALNCCTDTTPFPSSTTKPSFALRLFAPLPYRASFPLTPSSSCSNKPQHIFQTQHPCLSITTAAPQADELLHQLMTAGSKSCFTTFMSQFSSVQNLPHPV